MTDVYGNKTAFEYDGNGNPVKMTDANGNVIKHEYDVNGNKIKTIFNDNTLLVQNTIH